MDWDLIRTNTKRAFKILSSFVGIILGIVMIAQGAHRIYLGIDDGASILYYMGNVSILVGGFAVCFWSRKDIIRMTGTYALTLGLSRFFLRTGEAYAATNTAVIVLEVILIILAFNLMRIGIHFARGTVVNRTSLIATSSMLAGVDLLLLSVYEYAGDLLDFLPFDMDPFYYVVNFLMYVSMVALLDTEVIRENTELAKQARVLDRVRAAYSLEEGSYVYDDVAKGLLDRSGPLWRSINDGTVRSEMAFQIIGDGKRSDALVQIWEGKDPMFMTVVSEGDSVFNANRFLVDELSESDGVLYGYGRDGTRFKVLVKGREQS